MAWIQPSKKDMAVTFSYCLCGVLGYLAHVHGRVRSVCCVVCAASRATRLLFTADLARRVVLRVRCPRGLGSASPLCMLGVLGGVCGVMGGLILVHQCVCSACCVAGAVSRTTWLLFTGVPSRCVVLCVRCPGPLGSCSAVRTLRVLCCLCGVLRHLAPVHRRARSACCVACAVSSATWLLITGVYARRVVLRVRCPGPIDSGSPVCMLGVLRCGCGVLDH